jgi:hypothetical protein
MGTYWGWFDDDRKKDAALKIAEAVEAYHAKFGVTPNVVLVNEADSATHPQVRVRIASFLRRHNFWIGWEDEAIESEPLAA